MKRAIIKQCLAYFGIGSLLLLGSGCAPAVFSGAAVTGGYMLGGDERSAGQILDDSSITAKINLKMTDDAAVKGRNIDVDTIDGRVLLTGMVDSEWEAERAVNIARKVPGVKEVRNNLQVGTRSFKQVVADKVIFSKIRKMLIQEPNFRSLNIDVDVYNGVVTLTGTVKEAGQKDRVIEIAQATKGTVSIVDNIFIKEPHE